MSPRRLSPPSSTFNYFEDTLEIARLHNSPAFIHAASDREGSELLILQFLVATPLCPDSRIMPFSDPLTQLGFTAGLKGCFRPRSCGVLCSKSAA
jgi:hypothetical protein